MDEEARAEIENLKEQHEKLRREFNRLVDEVSTLTQIITGNPNASVDVRDDF